MDLHVQVSKNNMIMQQSTDLDIVNETYLFGILKCLYSIHLFIFILDLDECVTELDNCHKSATCNNTFGCFECTCNSGFVGDGVNCTSKLVTCNMLLWQCFHAQLFFHTFIHLVDINECELETYPCNSNASCTDTEGSFNCTCREGFEGNGFNCTGMK